MPPPTLIRTAQSESHQIPIHFSPTFANQGYSHTPPSSLLRCGLTSRDRGVPQQQQFCVRIKGNRNQSFTHSMHSMIDSQAGNQERVCLLPYPYLSWQESLFTTRRSPLSMSMKGRRVHCIWNRNTNRKTTPFQAWLCNRCRYPVARNALGSAVVNKLRLLRQK